MLTKNDYEALRVAVLAMRVAAQAAYRMQGSSVEARELRAKATAAQKALRAVYTLTHVAGSGLK